MEIQELMKIQESCKLSDLELSRFNQLSLNKSRYPSGRTAQEMRLPLTKIANLIVCGYLKKSGFCFINGGSRQDLFLPVV